MFQLAMGLFNLGFITTYMSDPMIGGFTTGAAVHVGTSQVKYLFGLKIPRSDGVCQIIRVRIIQYIFFMFFPVTFRSIFYQIHMIEST